VYEHVSDTRIALLDRGFYAMCNLVALIHGNVAVDSSVEIDIKIESHFSGAAFLNLDNPRD
jgi:hypothetical protein